MLGLCLSVLLTAAMLEVKSHVHHPTADGVVNMNQQQPVDFNDPSIVGNQAHLREHLKEELGTGANKDMSPEEMEFHFFRLHDTNNDTLLDGLEILKAMTHMVPPGMEVMPHEMQGKTQQQIDQLRKERHHQMLQGVVMLVDKLLETDDRDKDGYLSYPEYIVARRRDTKQMMKAQQEMLRQAEAYKQQQASMNSMPKTGL